MVEQAEGVEGVADDLCDGPGCDEEQHAVLTLHLGEGRGGEKKAQVKRMSRELRRGHDMLLFNR